MFQSKQKANHFFQQVSNHLKPGGEFIAVTMDSRVIVEELINDMHGVFDGFDDNGVLIPTTMTIDDDDDDEHDKVDKVDKEDDEDCNSCRITTTGEGGDKGHNEELFKQVILSINKDNNKHIASTEKILSFRNDLGYLILQIKFSNDMCTRFLRYHHNSISNESSSTDLMKNQSLTESTSSITTLEDNMMYGIQYTFTLKDSDTEAAVDAPEW